MAAPTGYVVTAAEMRAAEAVVIRNGIAETTLMAGAAAAVCAHVQALAPDGEVLILCGPGHNGGDGYVAARLLAAEGRSVRVAALGQPTVGPALEAQQSWAGPVVPLAEALPADVVVDALFGIGVSRPLGDDVAAALARLVRHARFSLAVDLPSGVGADDGQDFGAARVTATLAIAATKPAHFLMPSAALCGSLYLADIGVPVHGGIAVIDPPVLVPPSATAHKYSRGMVGIVGGAMPGAALLAAEAALRVAGYVAVAGLGRGGSQAIVHTDWRQLAGDDRLGALVIGPGLGRDEDARATMITAIESAHPLVIDGDALWMLGGSALADMRRRRPPVIMTPHHGEFERLFPAQFGTKFERASGAAALSGATIIYKGADTVIATPDGRIATLPMASPWLATAGTGDVLAGMVAAFVASGLGPLAAAKAAVWLHRECADLAGVALIADDLPPLIPRVIAARLIAQSA